jgi:DNA-binding IclR family transcriptional regulator
MREGMIHMLAPQPQGFGGHPMLRQRESKSAPVGVVVKVLRILDTLHATPSGLQLKEIARLTGINKSTAYRFLAHLESEGYLFRDDAGAYVIGPKLARLGSGINYEETLRKISRPVLHKLWQITGETTNLAILDGHEVLYLDVIESSHTFRLASQVGARRPLYCTSLGKAMAAYLPGEDLEDVLASRSMERFTPHTITTAARLKKEFAKIRQCGYAMDDEEAVLGARCVAAPIFDESGKVTAAISTSGPITRMTTEKARVFAAAVKKGAHVISSRLGYAGL